MTDRAELIGKLEAMRQEVRRLIGNPTGIDDPAPTLARAVDAIAFVVIGMLEAEQIRHDEPGRYEHGHEPASTMLRP